MKETVGNDMYLLVTQTTQTTCHVMQKYTRKLRIEISMSVTFYDSIDYVVMTYYLFSFIVIFFMNILKILSGLYRSAFTFRNCFDQCSKEITNWSLFVQLNGLPIFTS